MSDLTYHLQARSSRMIMQDDADLMLEAADRIEELEVIISKQNAEISRLEERLAECGERI